MRVIYRFSMDAAKSSELVLWILAVIWVVVMGCSVWSIVSQPFSRKARSFWLFVVLVFPLVGLLAYLPFSVRKESYQALLSSKKH